MRATYNTMKAAMSSREINIKLLTWGSIQLSAAELLIVARHRHMLAIYVGSLFLMYELRFHTGDPGLPTWINIMIYSVVQIMPLPMIIGTFWAVARFSKGNEPVQIFATPLIFGSIFISVFSMEFFIGLFGGTSNLSLWQLVAWSLLQSFYGEILGAIVGNVMLPGMLAQIRRNDAPPQEAVVQLPGPKTDEAPQAEPVPMLVVGNQTFPAQDLLHARAEGNYVDLTFTTGRLYTLAALSSVTEQLSGVDGCMLSRSVWVSGRATAGYRRQGANYVVALIDDREFRVARSRADRVLPWLKSRFSMSESA